MKWILMAIAMVAGAAQAQTPRAWAAKAQARLGPATWSRIIRIDNAAPDARYPSTVDALVFELGGVLWFYTSSEGTQSLSLHRGRLAEEKADLAPLLRAVHHGFVRHESWQGADRVTPDAGATLPNGCLIDSVAAWRTAVARGELVTAAELLFIYAEVAGVRHGHTVLVCETPRRWIVIDPQHRDRVRIVPPRIGADAAALARWLRPDLRGVETRTLALPPERTGGLYAGAHRAKAALTTGGEEPRMQ